MPVKHIATRLSGIALVLLAAIEPYCSGLPATQPSSASAIAIAQTAGTSSSYARLSRGIYYVTFRPDQNKLRYFSVAPGRPRFAWEALVNTSDCQLQYQGERIVVDRQGALDIFLPCTGGAGVLQMPIGAVGVVSPLREIITQFPNTAWLTGDIDANGNAAVGYNVSDTQKASHLIQLYGPSARGIAQ